MFLLLTLTYVTPFPIVSIADIEQGIVYWDNLQQIIWTKERKSRKAGQNQKTLIFAFNSF